jgi:hypothetical protein
MGLGGIQGNVVVAMNYVGSSIDLMTNGFDGGLTGG